VSGTREKHAEILSNRGGDVAIGYQLELEKASRCGNCGQILKIWTRNKPAKYNRYVITNPTRFQDHRHRPLGHPSASKIAPEIARSGALAILWLNTRGAGLSLWPNRAKFV
jgi:ribosomal protein L34E